jgi:endonuclease/exonuclease/phosphatase family metal-dependent hydrolase
MRIISWNVWDLPIFAPLCSARMQSIGRYLAGLKPDIICLQEAWDPKNHLVIHKFLGDTYYRSVHSPFGGLVTYSRFPIACLRFKPFGPMFHWSLGEHLGRKGVMEVVVKTGQGLLRVLNTHLYHPQTRHGLRIRLAQLKSLMQQAVCSSYPAILAGDFNQHGLLGESDIESLLTRHKFTHPSSDYDELPTYRVENPLVSGHWTNRQTRNSKRYDYILVRGLDRHKLEVHWYAPDYLAQTLSDHDPLLLVLEPALG